MIKKTKNKKMYYNLEKTYEFRNFEINNFWKRGWFFGALLIFLLTGYFNIYKEGLCDFLIYISFLSFLVSIAQSLINRGSKYWQERWEYKAKNRESKAKIDITLTKLKFNNGEEKNYIDACILDKGESFFTRAQRFSVSKLTFLVWDIISIATLFLWIKDVCLIFETKVNANTYVYLFHGIVILYIFLFFCTGKLYQKLKGGTLDSRDYIKNKNPK